MHGCVQRLVVVGAGSVYSTRRRPSASWRGNSGRFAVYGVGGIRKRAAGSIRRGGPSKIYRSWETNLKLLERDGVN